MKCLLVDDEPGIREGLAALLRRKGHDVRTAGDCAAAAAALVEQAFDVVVTDWRLPDGVASSFVVDCTCPVVAVSGHPEEVEQHAIVHAVLGKPVTPSRLVEALLATVETPTAPPLPLPLDAQRVIAAANALVPGTEARVDDDGTFVTWSARIADDVLPQRLAGLGGDLRVGGPVGDRVVELRICRDGRPDPGMRVCRLVDEWPDAAEFAVDCDGTGVTAAAFEPFLRRAHDRLQNGRRVHFLNVPDCCREVASDWEKAHDMPMKAAVGPRLPAVLVDLWSQP